MKKITLFLAMAMMTVMSFAQAQKAGEAQQRHITKESMVQMRGVNPDASKLTVQQRQKQVTAVRPATVSKQKAAQRKGLSTAKSLANAAAPVFKSSLKEQPVSGASKLNVAGKAGKSMKQKAKQKVGGTDLIVAPAGLETETYFATGFSYLDYAEAKYEVQIGKDGNDLYIQGLFRANPEAWIKGTVDGNTVTFAHDQYLGEAEVIDLYSGESMGMAPVWLEYTEDFETYQDFTMALNIETGVMDDAGNGLLAFALNDELDVIDALGYLRLTPADAIPENNLITPPASAEQWGVDISCVSYSMDTPLSNSGMMAIDGNDIYVLGLCPNCPGWVKGTLGADNKVTFAKGQYVGVYGGMFDMYFMATDPKGAEGNLCDAVATWDAESKTLTFDNNTWIVENANPLAMYYLDVYYDVVVEPMGADRQVVIPPVGLETSLYKTSVVSQANYPYASSKYDVAIGFDGDDAYMRGLFFYAPNAWLKGTRNADGSLTFPKNQYMGTVQGYDVYAVSCDDDENILDDFTFDYDAELDQYTHTKRNTNISFSVAPDCTDAVEIIHTIVMDGPDSPYTQINTDVIYEQPEGEMTLYSRAGGAYYTFWSYLIDSTQNGTSIKVVVAPDGKTVYMENPVSQAPVEGGSWVKGTIEGNKIHMPLKQCILYSEEEGYGYMTATFKPEYTYDENNDEYYYKYTMTNDKEIVFVINEDGTISMERTSEIDPESSLADYIYGIAYTDNLEWAQLGDYNSVYTPFTENILTIPEGLDTEKWAFMYNDGNYSSADIVEVAIDGNKMYIAGLSQYVPEAAIVGTIADGKVTFSSDQYMGTNSGYIAYATFAEYFITTVWDDYYEMDYEMFDYNYLPELSFSYDTAKKRLTSEGNVAFLLNAGKGADEILAITFAYDPKFSYFEDKAATPADPEILGFDSWFEDYGYDIIALNVKLEDVDGNYMDQTKLFYKLYVKVDGEAEEYVLYSDEYAQFVEDGIDELVEIPFTYVAYDDFGYEDIAAGGSNVVFYQTGFDDYGVQSVYYGGGVRTVSNIVWLNSGTDTTGISNVQPAAGKAQLYDLMGRKLGAAGKGLVIVKAGNKVTKTIKK